MNTTKMCVLILTLPLLKLTVANLTVQDTVYVVLFLKIFPELIFFDTDHCNNPT